MQKPKAGQRQNKAEGHDIKLKVFIDFWIHYKFLIASDNPAILKML